MILIKFANPFGNPDRNRWGLLRVGTERQALRDFGSESKIASLGGWRRSAKHRQFFHRSLPYFGGILLAIFAEAVIYRPILWKTAILLSLFSIAVISFLISRQSKTLLEIWPHLYRPAFFSIWSIGLILFVNSGLSRHAIAILLGVLPILYWENLWRYAWMTNRYNPEALENISIALNTLAIWYAGMLFYILHLDPSVIQFRGQFLNEFVRNNTILVTTAILMISVFLMDFNTLWLKRYNRDKTWLWIIITTLLIGEIFWALNFLPHSVAIKSILLVLAYYLLISLGRAHFDGNLNLALLRRYLYLMAAVLLAVLISARWVV